VIDVGVAEGTFTCADPQATAVRLAALMDGLAVQVSLRDPDVPEERLTGLWLEAAAAELGLSIADVTGRTRRPRATKPAT